MIELFRFALDSIDIGIIIIDSSQYIRFWNRYMEKISQIKYEQAIGRPLSEVCDTFQKKRYQDILNSVFEQNLSRFCSSKLHKAFVYPAVGDRSQIRQNMKIEPTQVGDEVYALIQIDDITDEVSNEYKLTSLINELRRGYLEVKESEELNKKLAQTDALTKIANRHAIVQHIDTLFQQRNYNCGYALLFLDLDGFKHVNDTYGHLMGDSLLIAIAEKLKNKVRKDDMVARLGGDEFLVLLGNIKSKDAVECVGAKLVEEIAKPIDINGITIKITASIGIAMLDDTVKNTSELIKKADEAMYIAKRSGKNKFVIYQRS